ncbi:MAG: DEAD/DEAH box helicase family protein [Planctomycetes bacterium]|nr:DEAD/DEAH box helicase family protein [Planctomycetota bacterium]
MIDLSTLTGISNQQQAVLRDNVVDSLTGTQIGGASRHSPPAASLSFDLTGLSRAAEINISAEVKRICSVPISYMPSEADVEKVSKYYCPSGEWKLWPMQVKAMIEYHNARGLFAPISVGGGKTLICVLIANDAYTIYGKRKILHLCPPTLVGQLERKLKREYMQPFNICVPYHFLTQYDKKRRLAKAKSGQAGVYVLSYSLLSSATGTELLEAIEPEVIIGDEIQQVTSDRQSARGRRLKAARDAFDSELIGLSGTITKKRPMEYHYLVTRALGDNSFMPKPINQATEWSRVIDCDAGDWENVRANMGAGAGPLSPLVNWSNDNFGTKLKPGLMGFRTSFKQRVDTTPGVVPSIDDENQIGSTLVIQNHTIPEKVMKASCGWDKMQEHLKNLLELFISPDGDEIDHPFAMWRWRYELESFGCYNNLFWPEAEKAAAKRKISVAEAMDLLVRSKQHHEALQDYHKELRKWIPEHGRAGLDAPALIGANMHNYGASDVGAKLYDFWSKAKNLYFDEIIEREKEFIRVCDFKVNELVRWAKQFKEEKCNADEGGIIWYINRGVGKWIVETLKKANLPVLHCLAGDKYSEYIEEEKYKGYFCVTSSHSHHEGHDSPHWKFEYFAQFPRQAYMAEQCLGRFHRPKRKHDMAYAHTCLNSDFDWAVFSACLNDAAYLHQTQSARQKLIYANYTEKPKQIPYAVLKEWGAKGLHTETKEMKRTLERIG